MIFQVHAKGTNSLGNRRKIPTKVTEAFKWMWDTGLSFTLFYLFYRLFSSQMEEFDLLTRISYFVLFYTISSICAMITTTIILKRVYRILKLESPDFRKMNGLSKPESFIYKILSFILSSILIIIGWYQIILHVSENIWLFLLIYLIIRLILYFSLKSIAKIAAKNIWIVFAITILYISIIVMAVIKLFGGVLIFE